MDNRLGPLNDDTPPLGESSQNIQEEQPEPRHRKRSVLLRILSALFRITVVVLVLGSLVIVFSVSVLPRITGAQALIVLSGSMEPALPVGSVVIAGPVEPHEIDVGDIIIPCWSKIVDARIPVALADDPFPLALLQVEFLTDPQASAEVILSDREAGGDNIILT